MQQPCVIALGFFDGVHIAHAALLHQTLQVAKEKGILSRVLTFDIHPDTLIYQHPVKLLNTAEERKLILQSFFHMDHVDFLHFDSDMKSMPWKQFVEHILIGKYHGCHFVCGYDFTFGKGGLGNAALLQEYCGQSGIGCDVIPKRSHLGSPVCSTLIREMLSDGRFHDARSLLGHPHLFSGTIVSATHLPHARQYEITLVPNPNILIPYAGMYQGYITLNGYSHPATLSIPLVFSGICTVLLPDYVDCTAETQLSLSLHSRLSDCSE